VLPVLVGAVILGKRVGFGKEPMPPHSLTMTMIGASMLWFGWFGFNAGSALEANGSAALAFHEHLPRYPLRGVVVDDPPSGWSRVSRRCSAQLRVQLLASVGHHARAGNVGIPGAFAIGIGVGIVCLWGVTGLKKLIKADDSLDVFGVHALGGVFGALMTGVFQCAFTRWPGFDPGLGQRQPSVIQASGPQLLIQIKAVVIVTVLDAVVATVAFLVVKAVVGLRVTEEQEREGLEHHVARRTRLRHVIGFSPLPRYG